MLACRIFGHRYRFRAEDTTMMWDCGRCEAPGGVRSTAAPSRLASTPQLWTARTAMSWAVVRRSWACSRCASTVTYGARCRPERANAAGGSVCANEALCRHRAEDRSRLGRHWVESGATWCHRGWSRGVRLPQGAVEEVARPVEATGADDTVGGGAGDAPQRTSEAEETESHVTATEFAGCVGTRVHAAERRSVHVGFATEGRLQTGQDAT